MDYQSFINIALPCYVLAAGFMLAFVISKNEINGKISMALFLAGLLMLLTAFALRWKSAGHVPFSGTFETLIFMSLLISAFAVMFSRLDKTGAVFFGISILVVILLAASALAAEAPRPLVPALKSNWLAVHVTFSFISYAAYAIAFVAAFVYILQNGKAGEGLEELAYKCILFGQPFLTLGIATGAVWANRAWGTYWSWDPKETWALITWLTYGVYLHLRINQGWKGRKSAWLAIAGFCIVLFTYFGVNYLLSGLHSYR